ncbi:MAG: hypothetical protein OEL91_08670, partial [Burkholderiaceae bacterium]|nr:hypothetical protein [Burkholderiaceae bacterium]
TVASKRSVHEMLPAKDSGQLPNLGQRPAESSGIFVRLVGAVHQRSRPWIVCVLRSLMKA